MSVMRRMTAWGLLLAAIWLALSFATYDPIDDGGRGGSNLGGPVGRFFAGTLVEAFGIGAFILCFYMALIGYLIQVQRSMNQVPIRILGLNAIAIRLRIPS